MAACRLFPGLEHRLAFEFLGLTAAHTDQMVVIAVVIVAGELETAPTFGQFQLPQQIHRTEQPQGPVDRCQRDPLIASQEPLMHLLGTEVTAFTDALEQGQHPLPLGGQPLAAAMQRAAQSIGLQLGCREGWHSRRAGLFSTVAAIEKGRQAQD
jgi:hypothetical protein